ncbi:MAG: hypothetical protein ACOC0P_07920, partial [Planctomycetota bacterium]
MTSPADSTTPTATASTGASESNAQTSGTASAPKKEAPKVPFNEIEIRPFTRNDLVRLPKLLHECLGRHSTPEWLEWRFFQGVWPDRLAFYV